MFARFIGKKLSPTQRVRARKTSEYSVFTKQAIVGVVLFLLFVLFGAAVYFITHIPSMQIEDIDVYGGYTIPHATVEKRVHELLEGSFFALIPRTFTLMYPKRAIETHLLSIPRMKQVVLSRTDEQTISVVFDEYQPVALYCATSDIAECFFLDHTGFAFAQAPSLTGSAFVRYTEIGKEVEVGASAVPAIFMRETTRFAERLADELDLYVTHIMKIDALDVTYTVSGGGVIKVSERMSLDNAFDNLKTILSSEGFSHLETGAFAYIDLRFGDKVFVNEEIISEETITASSSTIKPLP